MTVFKTKTLNFTKCNLYKGDQSAKIFTMMAELKTRSIYKYMKTYTGEDEDNEHSEMTKTKTIDYDHSF